MIFFKIHELYESWGQLSLNLFQKKSCNTTGSLHLLIGQTDKCSQIIENISVCVFFAHTNISMKSKLYAKNTSAHVKEVYMR